LARVFAWLAMAGFNPSTGNGEFGIDVACGIQAEVSDFHEGARQDVKQESAHEFQGREPTDLFAARAEDDFTVIDVEQALVRDGNPVGVKTKVAKEGVGFSKWRLGVDHPVLLVQSSFFRSSKCGSGLTSSAAVLSGARIWRQLPFLKQAGEAVEEFSTKQHTEDLDRQKIPLQRIDPRTVCAKAAAGHDAMKVRVKDEIASPRMHHAGDAQQSADPFRIPPELQEGFGSRGEQQVEHQDLVFTDKRAQFGGQREDHVEVPHRQRTPHARRHPAGLSQCLALGTMTIAARVVDRALVATATAHVAMTAERTGAADRDVPQRPALHGAKRVRLSIRIAVTAE
jgi:hypothetical protein